MTATPSPTPQQLVAPSAVKFSGNYLCWRRVSNASGYTVRIDSSGPRQSSGPLGQADPNPCGDDRLWEYRYYSSPSWGEHYCVRARGDGLRYLDSEERCTLAVQPTAIAMAAPTAMPTATQNPVLTQLAEPRGLKVVGGNTFCWQEVEGTTRYDAWRVAAKRDG